MCGCAVTNTVAVAMVTEPAACLVVTDIFSVVSRI